MNIIVLAQKDFGNSGWQMVQAVRKMTSHRIHLVTAQRGNYEDQAQYSDYCIADYMKDFPFPDPHRSVQDVIRERKHVIKAIKAKLGEVQDLINEAHIIHWKGDWLPSDHFTQFLDIPPRKTIISVSGSGFRRRNKANHHAAQLGWYPIRDYIERSDYRTAFTPDLNYPEYQGIYTQQAIDSTSQVNCWKNKARPIIAHSPSHRGKKGTNIFLEAIEELRAKHFKFDLDLIEKVTKKECIERKKNATIFFCQASGTFYGNSALESMQFGIPTIAQIPYYSFRQSSEKLTAKDCPVINVNYSVDSIVDAIEKLLNPPPFHPKMSTISKRTKAFCDGFHSYETVGTMWDEIYTEVV